MKQIHVFSNFMICFTCSELTNYTYLFVECKRPLHDPISLSSNVIRVSGRGLFRKVKQELKWASSDVRNLEIRPFIFAISYACRQAGTHTNSLFPSFPLYRLWPKNDNFVLCFKACFILIFSPSRDSVYSYKTSLTTATIVCPTWFLHISSLSLELIFHLSTKQEVQFCTPDSSILNFYCTKSDGHSWLFPHAPGISEPVDFPQGGSWPARSTNNQQITTRWNCGEYPSSVL